MTSVLNRKVLVLNRHWQLLDEKSVAEAVTMMASDAATGMDIGPDHHAVPVTWAQWLKLPILAEDEVIHTVSAKIRMPTVIVASNYAGVPKRRPAFNLRTIARTYGNRCAYTNELLPPSEWSKDHVVPLSRGGKDTPDNVVLASKRVNNRKGAKLPHEAGLPTPKIKKLVAPTLEPTHPHHLIFIK